jgi:uncharacterized membrane protein
MSEKRTKYDTDPLDPDFERRITSVFSGRTAQTAPSPYADSEAPTRRIEEKFSAPYQSVFTEQAAPSPIPSQTSPINAGQTASQAALPKPTNRTLPGVNLPENIALVIPYLPFFLGAIAAVVELLMLPRTEARARFHAAQGLALHLAVMCAGLAFRIAGGLAGVAFGGSGIVRLISFFFWMATTTLFIISMVRVWKGEPHVITPLKDATNWLDEHIEKK